MADAARDEAAYWAHLAIGLSMAVRQLRETTKTCERGSDAEMVDAWQRAIAKAMAERPAGMMRT